MTNSFYVDVVDYETGEVVKTLGPEHSQRKADKLERSVNINMNHAKYYTRQRIK